MPVAQVSVTDLIAISSHVEKLGIIGFLVVVVGVLAWALLKIRKELARTYRQRDRARMISTRYRAYLDQASINVNISDIEQIFKDDTAEEAT